MLWAYWAICRDKAYRSWVWDLGKIIMELWSESRSLQCVFQKDMLNISYELLVLKNTIFLTMSCPNVLFLRNCTVSWEEMNAMLWETEGHTTGTWVGRQPREVALGRCGSYHVIIISLENHRSEQYLLPHNALGCDYLMITILKMSFLLN